MSFWSYFKPTERNLSISGVILSSQLLVVFMTGLVLTLIYPEKAVSERSQAPGEPAAVLFTSFVLSTYVASCMCTWWLNEHLKK